jgi:hypothetical protein
MKPRLVLVALLAVAAVACGRAAADSVTYTDPDNRFLVRLPPGWHLYQADELAQVEVPFVHPVQGLEFPVSSMVGFDRAPARSPVNLEVPLVEADFPVGVATVRTIGTLQRDFVSRFVLTESVVPYRSLPNSRELLKEDFSFGRGYEGVRALVVYTDEVGRDFAVAYLISVTDPDDTVMFSVAAGCSRDCFIQHQDEIEQVVDSWLVNTRA